METLVSNRRVVFQNRRLREFAISARSVSPASPEGGILGSVARRDSVWLSTRRFEGRRRWSIGLRLIELQFVVGVLLGGISSANADDPPMPAMKMGSAGSTGGAVGEMAESASPAKEKTSRPNEPERPTADKGAGSASKLERSTSPADETPGDEIPPYHIAEVAVEGTVLDDRADLTVKIDVEISRDDGWYDVPLRLGQGHISSKSGTGPGQQGPAEPAIQNNELHWRFRGAGTHQLEFKLWVPVRTDAAGRHLQLSLPLMPDLFEANVKLRFPGDPVVIRSYNRNAILKPRPAPDGTGTLLDASVPGGRLELLWQERGREREADWAASSTFSLKRASSAWEISVQQSIRRTEIGRATLLVHPPAGFTVLEVKGPNLESWSADSPGVLKLVFGEDAGDKLDLQWILRAPFPPSGGIVDLVGFEIDGVRAQDGRIRVADVPGYQVLPLEDALRFLERVDDDGAPVGEKPAVLCYQFSSPHWRLSLNAKQVEPLFTCSPKYELTVLEDRVQLLAGFRIRQEAGEVRHLRVDTSGLEQAGWLMAPRGELRDATVQVSPGGGVQFDWPPGIESEKVAELRFERPVQNLSFSVPLPAAAAATWPESAQLTVRAADKLRLKVEADGETVPAPLSPPLQDAALTRVVAQASLRPGLPAIRIDGSIEQRSVTASAVISVLDVQPTRVILEQTIRLNVEYGRIDALRFQIPEGFPITEGGERFAFGVRIDGRDADGLEWTNGALRLKLPQPVMGRLTVVLGYGVPRPEGASEFQLPVVPVLDAPYSDVAIETVPSLGITVTKGTGTWRAVPTSAEKMSWIAPGGTKSANLSIIEHVRAAQQRVVVHGAHIQTRVDARGVQHTVAHYRIQPGPTSLTFGLERPPTNLEILVAGLAVDDLQELAQSTPPRWQVKLPSRSQQPIDVIIRYDLPPAAVPRAWSRLVVDIPDFSNVYLEELIWSLELPDTEVVLASPRGFSKLFDWQREGLFWKRNVSPRYVDTLHKLGFDEAASHDRSLGRSRYSYNQYGSVTHIELLTIDRSLVVLVGAGVTLIVGFFFWTFPRLRNAATLLLLGFSICLAGLWFSEPIQVFLQPAIFGAVLATIATAIDNRARTRSSRPGGESSIRVIPRPVSAGRIEPIRSTLMRPAGSDHGVPG